MLLLQDSPVSRPLGSDSWYLDPLVARQKAAVNRACVRRWAGESASGTILKTDLFEEANGEDHILGELASASRFVVGVDCLPSTVERAARRFRSPRIRLSVADLRVFNFAGGVFDLVVSTSTLDHFESRAELVQSLAELGRVLRPGGRMIVVLDNPLNPAYFPLKWCCRWFAPFRLGYAMTRRGLCAIGEAMGLEILGKDYLIHNPRIISTVLFLLLRKLMGGQANGAVQVLLAAFALCGKLPTRCFSACFFVVCLRKPAASA